MKARFDGEGFQYFISSRIDIEEFMYLIITNRITGDKPRSTDDEDQPVWRSGRA